MWSGWAVEMRQFCYGSANKVCRSRSAVRCADLRVSNVMELNTKEGHADSTNEASLSGNDLAGREAALSFSREDMTKAAKKRYPFCWLLRPLLPSIASHLAAEAARLLAGSHMRPCNDICLARQQLPQGVPTLWIVADMCTAEM